MKKSVIPAVPSIMSLEPRKEWLDLEQLARVEVTSEDPHYPVESVFLPGEGAGWRAAEAGRQVIRLLFEEPQTVRRIYLKFSESEVARTQEFTLAWASSREQGPKEIVRQQWNFSPDGSNDEVEDYEVSLEGASILQIAVIPNVGGGDARASLARWRVA